MKKKKAMISQPMTGKTTDEVLTVRAAAKSYLEGKGYTVVDTYFKDEWRTEGIVNRPLFFLAKSLEKMSQCDAVYFCNGWLGARGCRVEHTAATQYGLELLFEGDI